ncbi:transcription antitermination factor NusB [Streptomyces sp. YIM 98790]|uniref:RsmB/NOP family class I SAM-dependent RNA methyltransferase n=1 Tax=Streptomyces sp. YIM 98790 TaxID=2689077 RepID=UPI00140D4851|nr:transcription antitermination factor NusB [Streptomyces sp. YIM 98790]
MSTRPRRPAAPAPSSSPQRRYRRPRKDPVRLVAHQALRAVQERDAYANLVLPPLLAKARRAGELDARDAALATELVYGALRHQGTYRAVLAACVDRPLDRVDPPVLDVLVLGAHQLLGTRIPSHAAVSTAVELARSVLGDGRAKFVNAVLRKVARRSREEWLAEVAPDWDGDPEGHLSVVHSHPRWVVSALWDALGGDRADIEALLAADNQRPEVTLAARPGRATAADLLREAGAGRGGEGVQEGEGGGGDDEGENGENGREGENGGGELAAGRWSPWAVRLAHGDPAAVAAVRDGRAGVQDEGSQLTALALAAAPLDGGPDAHWLDLCAGPGGKAALLAGLAAERGARLLAAEKQPHRARLVARALAGTPGPYQVIAADGTRPPWRPGAFDRVLADVPCTGLGALRRRPEARWRRRPEDLAQLGPLQRALLRRALEAVRPGGAVAYVTCSPHLAETRAVVDDVLRRPGAGPVAQRLDARPLLPGVPALGDGPDVQLWPHLHGTDAMHLTLLRRIR